MSSNGPVRSQISNFTDAGVLLHGANHIESTKLILTLRIDEVGLSIVVVLDWSLPTCE